MSRSAKSRSEKRVVEQVEDQLNQLVAAVRRLDNEGNYVDCEVIVKATILVVNGHTAADALATARVK